jgi:hypothetical protein
MRQLLRSAALTALVAGGLDIAAAMIKFYSSTGKDPLIVLRFIASGVMGKEAMAGGLTTAAYGLGLHAVIAFGWTFLFFLSIPQWRRFVPRIPLQGILYGIMVWCGMNLVVLPLSSVTQRPFDTIDAVSGILILIACIGMPVAYSAQRFYAQKERR